MEAIIKREIALTKNASRFIGIIMFVIMMSLGAFARIPLPFSPIPITLQTFFVLLSAASLGTLGTLPQLAYIALGAAGLPLFSGAGSGIVYLFGPTAGYIWGFILAALLISRCIRYCSNSLFFVFALFCLADFVLLLCGVAWLKLTLGYPTAKLLFMGFLPFIPGDLVKAFLAAAIYLKLRPRLQKNFW